MATYTVKDLMVPLSEYATVLEDASLYEAVVALEKAQAEFSNPLEKAPEKFGPKRHPHRAILVLDKDGQVAGKISQLDALTALSVFIQNQNRPVRMPYGAEFLRCLF